ncbi:MAG: SRPBCC domain-containing protein [Gemmatimonadetes bacterium]|nr:SRPBCC domain-containing protein [Gemmatimonadota bacterium]
MRIPARLRDLVLGATGGVFLAGMLGLGFPGDAVPTADRPAEAIETGGFTFTFERTVPGTPRVTFDALTGDISGWWDHTFSGNPYRLYIEPRPGGGFYELFNESGDGVRHAVVTAAERGALLRFEGPLGLAGHALHMVATYELAEVGLEGTSTNLKVTVHAAGEMQDGWAKTVEDVWHHFIDERFVPYMEAGGRAGN